ncbi:hypothetical protein CRE_09444 [Caenorhabditis remanei]|uniref:Serpentine Receptor, class H n=1 Tax=Caenorhabditis remanei TaxID=31234 RepID=E3LIW4_CAERE|nr:hypothetical protein CRE_09444 [Caenorhabditis remanei]
MTPSLVILFFLRRPFIMTDNSSFLSEYFKTIYPSKCSRDERYLASKDGLVYWSRLITLFSLPIQLLTTFCILRMTPKSMSFVRTSLLNLNSWCILIGLITSFVITPFSFLPYNAGFTIGLASDLGVPLAVRLYFSFTATFVILISITILFENRNSMITCNIFAIKRSGIRIFWISLNVLMSILLPLPVFLNLPEQSTAKLGILKVLPCPAREFFTDSFLVMASDPSWVSYFTYSLMTVYFSMLLQILFFSICCIYYLLISKNSQISSQTRRLQIRAFFGLLGQTFIPIVFDALPMTFFLNRQNPDQYDQYNNNLMSLSVVIHNGATSLCILLVHHAYRKFLVSFIWRSDQIKVTVVQTASTISSKT